MTTYAPQVSRVLSEQELWDQERQAVAARQERRRRRELRRADRGADWSLLRLVAAGLIGAAVVVALVVVFA